MFVLPYARQVRILFIAVTLGCVVYMGYFLLVARRSPVLMDDGSSTKDTAVDPPALDLKPYETLAAGIQTRDIFSSGPMDAAGVLAQTPKGQFPAHLKVVGIVIARPAQIIIEDSDSKQTYFISEHDPQAGIKIARVDKDQIIVNYQGQNISVPIHEHTKTTVNGAPIP